MTSVSLICGVDEAGRGPWAGPVCAGAVILPDNHHIPGLTDSKKLSEKRRHALEGDIKAGAIGWALGWASPAEIDALNIRQATHLAMHRAINGLSQVPSEILIDGNDLPKDLPAPGRTIIKGDLKEPSISAASILAKNARDRLMVEADQQYPGYGFCAHKGYGVAAHSEALTRLGPCPLHRKSFAPVRRAMA